MQILLYLIAFFPPFLPFVYALLFLLLFLFFFFKFFFFFFSFFFFLGGGHILRAVKFKISILVDLVNLSIRMILAMAGCINVIYYESFYVSHEMDNNM